VAYVLATTGCGERTKSGNMRKEALVAKQCAADRKTSPLALPHERAMDPLAKPSS